METFLPEPANCISELDRRRSENSSPPTEAGLSPTVLMEIKKTTPSLLCLQLIQQSQIFPVSFADFASSRVLDYLSHYFPRKNSLLDFERVV